jgi:hypothetical protein
MDVEVQDPGELVNAVGACVEAGFAISVLPLGPELSAGSLPSLTARKHSTLLVDQNVLRLPQMKSQALPALPAIALLLSTMVLAKNGKSRLLRKQISAVWTTSSM